PARTRQPSALFPQRLGAFTRRCGRFLRQALQHRVYLSGEKGSDRLSEHTLNRFTSLGSNFQLPKSSPTWRASVTPTSAAHRPRRQHPSRAATATKRFHTAPVRTLICFLLV